MSNPSPNSQNDSRIASGRLDAAIADDPFEAGRVCTARLILKNPFDVPVIITEVRRPESSTLASLSGRLNSPVDEGDNRQNQPRGKIEFGGDNGKLASFLNIFSFLGLSGAIEFGDVSGGRKEKSINIRAENGSSITFDREIPHFGVLNIVSEPNSTVRIAGVPQEDGKRKQDREITIAPHCEVVEYFPFKTASWLLFKPTRIPINVQINYRTDSQERTQVVDATLEVKPPLMSMIIGALVGAILGAVAKGLSQPTEIRPATWAIYVGSSIVMSFIATITLSRKTGTQGFITVEDFFGAFVVGTLIGYTGSSYFDSLLKAQGAETPP
jgi:hypothetical protein